MEGVQDFFFLMYIPNPARERVRIFPDGEELAMHLSYNNFRQLLLEVGGYDIIASVNETLMSYGTPWLYIREKNKIVKINAAAAAGASVIDLIKTTIEDMGKEGEDLLNPASRLAGAVMTTYTLKDPFMPSPNTKPGTKVIPTLKIR